MESEEKVTHYRSLVFRGKWLKITFENNVLSIECAAAYVDLSNNLLCLVFAFPPKSRLIRLLLVSLSKNLCILTSYSVRYGSNSSLRPMMHNRVGGVNVSLFIICQAIPEYESRCEGAWLRFEHYTLEAKE